MFHPQPAAVKLSNADRSAAIKRLRSTDLDDATRRRIVGRHEVSGTETRSLHPIADFSVDYMNQISSLWTITHTHIVGGKYLQSEDIQRLERPAMSSNLNIIEHVWDNLGRSIAPRRPALMTINHLKSALVLELAWLPQGLIRTLVKSIKLQCKNWVAVRGDHTPY
ncbi:DDE_3 domain-containing protein [Trichonephila clavipes]|nr:DDE_3 domain-containing protein [Trichonephila clavipes]